MNLWAISDSISLDSKLEDRGDTQLSGSLTYNRIVVKAGTNVLTGGGDSLNEEIIASLVRQIASVRGLGAEVLIVSSGAIAAGVNILGVGRQGNDVPFRQVLAAIGQSRLMHVYEKLFEPHEIIVAQALLSRGDINDREGYLNVRNTLLSLIELKVVPIINENDVVAVEEIGQDVFGDNDSLSALVANLVDADLLVILSDIDGLHTSDPHRDPSAELIPVVEKVDGAIEGLAGSSHSIKSRGGMRAKLEAAKLATASGVSVALANGMVADVVSRLVAGENVGTFFLPTSSKMESRKRWMLSGLSNRGLIVVDNGAAEAIRAGNRSLLPAGVSSVDGEFQRGDIVLVVDQQGEKIACGISSYAASDVIVIKGLRSDAIYKALGHQYGQEILHRNNMVLL